MTRSDYIDCARVPEILAPQAFGAWVIDRQNVLTGELFKWIRFRSLTILRRWTPATVHLAAGEVVMEDSYRELSRHLPIWFAARGRVLVTGLGLGCVVRGLLASPYVDHIDVIEIDRDIARIVGDEFRYHPRVNIYNCDAFAFPLTRCIRWDFAWHDIWEETTKQLHLAHARLICRFRNHCDRQGAWMLPRFVKRRIRAMGVIG
jgi:hypothetical protein